MGSKTMWRYRGVGVETITLRQWIEKERVADETLQGPSADWEMEEMGWERRMESGGRVAARLLEKDCVPRRTRLVLWNTDIIYEARGQISAGLDFVYLFVAAGTGH